MTDFMSELWQLFHSIGIGALVIVIAIIVALRLKNGQFSGIIYGLVAIGVLILIKAWTNPVPGTNGFFRQIHDAAIGDYDWRTVGDTVDNAGYSATYAGKFSVIKGFSMVGALWCGRLLNYGVTSGILPLIVLIGGIITAYQIGVMGNIRQLATFFAILTVGVGFVCWPIVRVKSSTQDNRGKWGWSRTRSQAAHPSNPRHVRRGHAC
jgi:hypothetical protein